MRLVELVSRFRESRDRARRGDLPAAERAAHETTRDEMIRALLAAQPLAPGQTPRQTLRAFYSVQVDIGFGDSLAIEPTLDLSSCGFAVLLDLPPKVNERAAVTLHLPGVEPIRAVARVANVHRQERSARVGFHFEDLKPADSERLALFVLDAVLEQFA